MDRREQIYIELRKKNLRITKQRKAIIDVLEGKHLTIQDIYLKLKEKGFENLATVYNNIDFLLEQKVIAEIYINGKKHYDLTIDELSHSADSHIHITCKMNNNIIELNNKDIFEKVLSDKVFENFNVDKLQIVVSGTCEHYNSELCGQDDVCYIKKYKESE